MKDSELLILLDEKPEEGLDMLLKQYGGMVYSVVRYKLGSAAHEDIEEITASVLYEVYRVRDRINPEKAALSSFISVLARRRAVDFLRRQSRGADVPLYELDIDIAGEADTEASVQQRLQKEALVSAINSLGPPECEIVLRKYFYGQKSREIAKALGLKLPTVNTKLRRSLEKLRVILGGERIDI